jgi:hypothetical protein
MTRRELILQFEQNNRSFLEAEVYEFQRRLANRPAASGDGLLLDLAIERLATFNAMMSAVNVLMRMSSLTPEVINYVTLDKERLLIEIERSRERIKRI